MRVLPSRSRRLCRIFSVSSHSPPAPDPSQHSSMSINQVSERRAVAHEQEGQRRRHLLRSKCQRSRCQGGRRGWGERSTCCCLCYVSSEVLRDLKSAASLGNAQECRPRCPDPCQILCRSVAIRTPFFRARGLSLCHRLSSSGASEVSLSNDTQGAGPSTRLAGARGGLLTLGQKW